MQHRYHFTFLIIWSLLGSLGAGQARAQTNFQPGYVLPLSGDTLRGEVDLRDARLSAQRCQFRASAQAEPTAYTPAQLRGYGITAERKHYRAFVVAVDSAAAQPYFLEVLVQGPATLYYLRDAAQHDFFYLSSPTLPLAQLKHSFVRVVREERVYDEEQNPFRNTLALALSGCLPVQSQLPRLLYREKDLRNVVAQYNVCQGQSVAAPVSKTSGSRITFGLVGGLVQHRLKYDGYPYLGKTSFAVNHTGFAVGPTLRLTSGRLPKLSLVVALLYEPEKYDMAGAATVNIYAVPSYTEYRTHFDLAYLRLPITLRYTYPRGKVRPILDAGFTPAYALKNDNTYEELSNLTKQFRPTEILLAKDAFRRYQIGLTGGLGLSTQVGERTVALLGRAEVDNGFSGLSGLGTSTLHLYALLSFDLTK